MKKYEAVQILIGIVFLMCRCTGTESPSPIGPVPSENQLRWQEMEYYAFIHFSLNTYTDQSWGFGNEDPSLFNPEKSDCRQWARICKESGMKGIILTVKHHCGFCLWPSEYTGYSVKNSPWKNGNGDMVREMSDACKEYGLKFGIYLSPWDRNHADYGKPEYIDYFRRQLTELLTNYGEVFEVWFDGANGGDGYYGGANETRRIDPRTYYDWKNTYALIRKLQPNAVIWNDGGDRGDLRWVGTEEGFVGETNWSLLNDTGAVDWNMLHYGLENGNAWVPAEVNTSIRPEWFYHPSEDDKVKSLPKLLEIFYNSIGRNACLLLNFPVMPNGLIHPADENAALGLAKVISESFAINLLGNATATATDIRGKSGKYDASKTIDGKPETYWATDDTITGASLSFNFGKPVKFNRFLIQEYIPLGQRVKEFSLDVFIDGEWKEISRGTTIGYKRIMRFPGVETSKIRFNIIDSKSGPLISNIGVYNAPVFLDAPSITRNKQGEVSISTRDIGPVYYYTLDGTEPTTESEKYSLPFMADGKIEIKAIAYDPASGKSSPVAAEKFYLSKKSWKLTDEEDAKAGRIFDGDPFTAWHKTPDHNLPIDLVIDLGEKYHISGFKYLPDQGRWSSGIISHYRFFISQNNRDWKLVSEGEFPNVKNNPVWQTVNFNPVNARYVKFRALRNTNGDNVAGYAELEIILNASP